MIPQRGNTSPHNRRGLPLRAAIVLTLTVGACVCSAFLRWCSNDVGIIRGSMRGYAPNLGGTRRRLLGDNDNNKSGIGGNHTNLDSNATNNMSEAGGNQVNVDSNAIKNIISELEESFPSLHTALFNSFGLFYMFIALYIVCDEFFVPSLNIISERLGLSDDVAGATFMAAGGSAPEFFTSLIGALRPVPSTVGVAAIVGSAVFNVLFVIGACGLVAKGGLTLHWYPLARDSLFYLIDLSFLAWAFQDGQIEPHEASILFLMYIFYCTFMAFSSQVEEYLTRPKFVNNPDDKSELGSSAKKDSRSFTITSASTYSKSKSNNSTSTAAVPQERIAEESKVEDEAISIYPSKDADCKSLMWYVFTLPLVLVLVLTIPDVRRKRCQGCWQNLYIPCFFLSIVWIAIFSYLMIEFTEVVGAFTEIPTTILALTLLAWGTSVPDLITSIIVTIQGRGDMAVSSSIGSNIFDITVGLPLPWIIFLAFNGGTFPVGQDGLATSILLLTGMLAFTIGSIMLNRWMLNKCLGIMMLVLWTGFTAYSIYVVLPHTHLP